VSFLYVRIELVEGPLSVQQLRFAGQRALGLRQPEPRAFGKHLQCSNWGNLETRFAQTSKFLIPEAPRFEPGALIGWRNPDARCTADWLGGLGKDGEHARSAI
jgi:hypothetical protein